MSKKIYFFYAAEEVKEYLKKRTDTLCSDKNLFIALAPSAYTCLREKGIAAENTLEYFTSDSHQRLLERSQILMQWLRANTDFDAVERGVQESLQDVFIYWTRLLVHHCLWLAEVAANVVERHNPDVLCASFRGRKKNLSVSVEAGEKYPGWIIKEAAKAKKLQYEDFSDKGKDNCFFFSYFCQYLFLLSKFLVKYGLCRLWEKKQLLRIRRGKNKFFLVTTKRYQMDKLTERMQEAYPAGRFAFLPGPLTAAVRIPEFIFNLFQPKYLQARKTQQKQLEDLCVKIERESALFSYRGICFADAVSRKARQNIAAYMVNLQFWTNVFFSLIEKLRPAAIFSNANRIDDPILAEFCRKMALPAILISHGSHVLPKNKYEHIEWGEHDRSFLRAGFSTFAVQSPLAEAYLEAFPSRGNTVKTGPLIWGGPVDSAKSAALFKTMFNERYTFGKTKVIVHAATPKSGNSLRLYVYETPDEYLRSVREIAQVVERMDDTILAVRFRPQNEIGISDLKDALGFSDKVILSVTESFRDVLGMADLLVSFSSTAIEEALQNKIPVLLYGGAGRYQHIAGYPVRPGETIKKSAVYCVEKAGHLSFALPEILRLKINKENDSLFKPYIYPQEVCVSLEDMLKTIMKEDKSGAITRSV